MKIVSLFFLSFFFANAQVPLLKNNNSIYIITRSTEHKRGIIAKDFNLLDSLSTHVGIGFLENDTLKLYNISNTEVNKYGSSLIIDDYNSFVNLKDFKYCSIWSYNLNVVEMIKFKKILRSFNNSSISFDNEFDLKNNKFYCSEFVHKVLNKFDKTIFHSKPIRKKLNLFYSKALKCTFLEYIPVDFFQVNSHFVKEFETFKH